MKDYLISMFIDDEMDLDDKIEFVETVHGDTRFKDETVEFLDQEKLLQDEMVTKMPPIRIPVEVKKERPFLSFLLPSATGFATAMVLVAALFLLRPSPLPEINKETAHRFVIYRPAAARTEIIGTFTNWQPTPMHKLGSSGYWSLTLNLPEGEHRYSYLVEDGRQVPDPTVLTREKDDFGGENSIIRVNGTI